MNKVEFCILLIVAFAAVMLSVWSLQILTGWQLLPG